MLLHVGNTGEILESPPLRLDPGGQSHRLSRW